MGELEQESERPFISEINGQEVESAEIYRTDVDLNIRIFFNPICWHTVAFFWDSMNGYGFKILFLLVKIDVTKFVNIKLKNK